MAFCEHKIEILSRESNVIKAKVILVTAAQSYSTHQFCYYRPIKLRKNPLHKDIVAAQEENYPIAWSYAPSHQFCKLLGPMNFKIKFRNLMEQSKESKVTLFRTELKKNDVISAPHFVNRKKSQNNMKIMYHLKT